MDFGISGRSALLTASTSGLALGCAKALVDAGVAVVLNGRDRARGEAAVSALSGRAHFIQADISIPEECARLHQEASGIAGPISILVNNASGPPPGGFSDHDREAWLKTIDTNLLSAVDLTQRCLPSMIDDRFGRIINITSFAVREPYPNLVLANSVRVAVHGAMSTLAREVADKGVTVNNLLPGLMDTPALQRIYQSQSRRENISEDDVKDRMARSIPVGRLGTATDFGPVCAFLCSRQAGYMTAQSITVDGGLVRALA